MAARSSVKGSLAATSAIAGVLAGVLGGWLTGHWLWAAVCGFLVLLGVVAGAEALKARQEARDETGEDARVSLSGNASLGDTLIAGRDISQTRTISNIDQSRTVNFRGTGGAAAIFAILAFGGALGGTVYISQQPDQVTVESPQSLVNDGNHGSPGAAAEGFLGNIMLDNAPGACSYVLPDEQSTCNSASATSSQGGSAVAITGNAGVGNAIISGTLALVPVIGRICSSGSCTSYSASGLPAGTSFQTAYEQAMNYNSAGNLIPCEEIDGAWYVSVPDL